MQNFKMQDYGLTPLSHTESLNTDGGDRCPCGPCNFLHAAWDFYKVFGTSGIY
jgi:hypothetical protein